MPKPLASFLLKFTIPPAPKTRGNVRVIINVKGRIMPVVDVSRRIKSRRRSLEQFTILRSPGAIDAQLKRMVRKDY